MSKGKLNLVYRDRSLLVPGTAYNSVKHLAQINGELLKVLVKVTEQNAQAVFTNSKHLFLAELVFLNVAVATHKWNITDEEKLHLVVQVQRN